MLPAMLLGALPAVSQTGTTWNLDPGHSTVKFSTVHMGVSDVDGNFKTFQGTLNAGPKDFSGSSVEFTVDVASVNTDIQMRDDHLKSDDFFNAAKYPKMTFLGKLVKKGDGYELIGTLTIRDKTKPITLAVTGGKIINDPYGNERAGFKVKGSINRFDYDLKWNQLLESGGLIVSEKISIESNVEWTRKK